MSDPSIQPAGPSDAAAAMMTEASASAAAVGKPRSLWNDAWHDLRRRPLFLGSTRLKEIVETESHEPAFRFPVAAFRNVAPALRSDLFMTVDISDLTLRYAR